MKDRKYLKNSILLCGEIDGIVFKRKFSISKIVNEGTSAVCYEAKHEKSGIGILKEFYPQNAYVLERNADGQLVNPPKFRDALERFKNAEKEYIEPYEMLMTAKQSSENKELSTFIPTFEIYNGCDEDKNVIGTTYIWTPKPELETFAKVCDEIHKHPNIQPEHKLVTILTAMESLTECVRALHCADLIHRDIKPSNFGFDIRGNKTLTQTLSLFDINTVCSVYGKMDGAVGTEGYMEPEVGYKAANNQTDIFSIGATLFHAVIVTDETKAGEYRYKSEYYDNLRRMVDNSELIRASEANSHPRLRNILTTILRKCLCERTYRYENCEELLKDLKAALYYALPSELVVRKKSGERWILKNVEKSLDTNKEKNSFLAIQYHLYEYPLYRYVTQENTLNVLVVGFGNYGQKFLDACLQNGQMLNKKLKVTVVSDDAADKEIYLSERPELGDFFNIDGTLADSEDAYGDITFEVTDAKPEDQAANVEILRGVLCEHLSSDHPHYVFIALGEDALNLASARTCKKVIEELRIKCTVSYICEGGPVSGKNTSVLCPLYVNRDIKSMDIYPEIERMAFNTHLIWEKNFNVGFDTIRANFRKPYYHDSCVSNVLSLKYKLHSLDIDLEKTDFNEAARLYRNKISSKSNRGIRNELIWIEHRRWVTEKLCRGWRRIKDLEDCTSETIRDKKAKRHICILKSKPNQMLAQLSLNNNYDKWEEGSNLDLSQLDELDRMSVELHRAFARKAKKAKEQNLLSGSCIAEIKSLIDGNKAAVAAFWDWFACMKGIWDKDVGKIRLYKGLKDDFLKAVATLPHGRKKALNEQVEAFDAMFDPIAASAEYRDWKQDDVALIDNIPFILTYTENAYMVIPFVTGEKNKVFENVSAVTIVNPSKIIYLCLIEKKQEAAALLETVPYVVGYMQRKHFKASVDFVIAYTDKMSSVANEELKHKIKALGDGRIRQVTCISFKSEDSIARELEKYLRPRSIGKELFVVEKNETKLSNMLKGGGFYNSFAFYHFDSTTQKFYEWKDCAMLTYIKKTPFITVSDMAAFQLSSGEISNQPGFFNDYKELWDQYTLTRSTWKLLCDVLGEHAKKNDIIVSFKKKSEYEKIPVPEEYTYIIPSVCRKSVEKIIQFLRTQGVLEQSSRVNGYTTDSCTVIIADRCEYRVAYDKLFSKIYTLMQPDAISLYLNTKNHEINIVFDELTVEGVNLTGGKLVELQALMKHFKDKGYILGLSVSNDGRVSFTYATRQIKELLTTAGKILEVYTYHKVKELGEFDDVVSGYEINWEGTEAKNEFDCILTKGFRTLFVECKARPDIEQNFYFRLSGLAKKFGINATAVLIADTREKSCYDNAPVNAMQRKRGNMMDVVTVWKPEEINNIGHILMRIINGDYMSEEE